MQSAFFAFHKSWPTGGQRTFPITTMAVETKRATAGPTQHSLFTTAQMAIFVSSPADEAEETPEEKARLDRLEAELALQQTLLRAPTPILPPAAPAQVPAIAGEPDSWGARRACSAEAAEAVAAWLRVHQAQEWRRHDAAPERIVDKDGTISVVQRVILSPPREQTTNPAFPVARFVYFCYATLPASP